MLSLEGYLAVLIGKSKAKKAHCMSNSVSSSDAEVSDPLLYKHSTSFKSADDVMA